MSDGTAIGPNEMLDIYQDIRVRTNGGEVSLQVNAYRNLSRGAASNGGCDDAIQVKDALARLGSAEVWRRAGGQVSYMDVFTGKGSPEAIAAVMQMFYDYSDRFIKMNPPSNSPEGKCSKWMSDDNLSWQDALQNICNEFIGLDCNGFVGNWLKRCDPTLKLNQNSVPKDVYNARKLVKNSVSEVEYWDIVVWMNFSHIAAIWNEGGGGSPRFYVCQSAGGGPRCNLYEIVAVSPGVFQLRGGIPQKDVPGNVYIISPWSS